MKYMGSKRSMLLNGLGELLCDQIPKHARVVDLFCGAASVSWFAATQSDRPVFSVDLQRYATVLAEAVVGRTRPINPSHIERVWIDYSRAILHSNPLWKDAQRIDSEVNSIPLWVRRARRFSLEANAGGLVLPLYGGYYFSPTQALAFDAMLQTLPRTKQTNAVCLAAIIISASQCAAAPGHTAQPFQPTQSSAPHLFESWRKDPFHYARAAVQSIAPMFARARGSARTGDALKVAETLRSDDLVFVDPPYSAMQYSRFYHVLETISRGVPVEVTGSGRSPPLNLRPSSKFSLKTQSRIAFVGLFEALATTGCTTAVTFPADICSNGVSGADVLDIAKEWFMVSHQHVSSRFSTLGGKKGNRGARHPTRELILLLRPR